MVAVVRLPSKFYKKTNSNHKPPPLWKFQLMQAKGVSARKGKGKKK